jgi:hypothetical protein
MDAFRKILYLRGGWKEGVIQRSISRPDSRVDQWNNNRKVKEYERSYKNIAKLRLNPLDDFEAARGTGGRITRSNNSVLKTKSINTIDEGIDQTKFKRPKKYIADQAADPNAPQWYSIVKSKISKEEILEITPSTQTTLIPNRYTPYYKCSFISLKICRLNSRNPIHSIIFAIQTILAQRLSE